MSVRQPDPSVIYLGGSFDPIHRGHLFIANYLQKLLASTLYLLPCNTTNSEKTTVAISHRLKMIDLTLENAPQLRVSLVEAESTETTYTLETVIALRQKWGPQCKIFFCLGMDAMLQLQKWYYWHKIFDYVHLMVCNRPGFQRSAIHLDVQNFIANRVVSHPDHIQSAFGKVFFVEMSEQQMNSTQLRKDQGLHSQWLMPKVRQYIVKHQLYNYVR